VRLYATCHDIHPLTPPVRMASISIDHPLFACWVDACGTGLLIVTVTNIYLTYQRPELVVFMPMRFTRTDLHAELKRRREVREHAGRPLGQSGEHSVAGQGREVISVVPDTHLVASVV
jgi:hypothetical protein